MRLKKSPFYIYLIFCSSTVLASTHYVLPNGSGDFPTIQDAVAAATNGDVIELADGVFSGDGNRDIDLQGKALTLKSENGIAEDCTIDCGGSGTEWHRAFIMQSGEDSDTRIEDITIINGHTNEGGAVYCMNSGGTFARCNFMSNSASHGGAILSISSSVTLDHCQFIGNSASYTGGAVSSLNSAHSIDFCTFGGNTANQGGGIDCSGCYVLLDHGTFKDNSASSHGAAIACARVADIFMASNTIFAFNTDGDAIYCYDGGWVDIMGCDVFGNTAGAGDCAESQMNGPGNFSEDPLFCPSCYEIQECSPCVDGYGWGQIGAHGVGCDCGGTTSSDQMSWGELKSIFR